MTAAELIDHVHRQGIALRADGPDLHVSYPPGAMDDALRALLVVVRTTGFRQVSGATVRWPLRGCPTPARVQPLAPVQGSLT
jgi:hypothetical protein